MITFISLTIAVLFHRGGEGIDRESKSDALCHKNNQSRSHFARPHGIPQWSPSDEEIQIASYHRALWWEDWALEEKRGGTSEYSLCVVNLVLTVAKIKTGRSVHDWLNTAHTFYLKSMSILKSFKNSTNLDQAETSTILVKLRVRHVCLHCSQII